MGNQAKWDDIAPRVHMEPSTISCVEDHNAYQRERYANAKKAGICTRCFKRMAVEGSTMCLECRIIARDYARERLTRRTEEQKQRDADRHRNYMKRKREQGMCYYCGKRKAVEGRLGCAVCLAKNRESKRKKRQRATFREMGVCLRCGAPRVEGYMLCEKHLQMMRDMAKRSAANAEGSQVWRDKIATEWERKKRGEIF